jgi:hypothetical protein
VLRGRGAGHVELQVCLRSEDPIRKPFRPSARQWRSGPFDRLRHRGRAALQGRVTNEARRGAEASLFHGT